MILIKTTLDLKRGGGGCALLNTPNSSLPFKLVLKLEFSVFIKTRTSPRRIDFI